MKPKKTDVPDAISSPRRFQLIWLITKSGECILSFDGPNFGAFTSAETAAWWLRRFADSIEKDGAEGKPGESK